MLPFERLGPYLLESAIGSGGMGSVFLGVDEQTGERAAVKVLSPGLASDASFRERFGTEIETLKKLRHPNIVQLLGYGEEGGQLFYAMELIEGRTLQQELQAGRRFNWREVTRIAVQICQALKHAHDRGVIHRDLKPANLIYTPEEQIKLADFGIAKLYGMSQLTIAGGVIGTADYMSPEQGEGKSVTARSDLYSLGSVLFTLLAGRPPFASRTAAEVIHKLRYEEAPRIRRLAPETPEEFERIIAQLLEKDPAKRIATPRALANRLSAMEHALSLETQLAEESPEFDVPDDEYRLADDDASSTQGRGETRVVTPQDRLTSDSDDPLRQHQKPTVALPAHLMPDGGQAAETTDTQSTHFTTFDEAARQRAILPAAPEDATPLWLKVAPPLVAVVLVLIAVWYLSRPASAESLYTRIMAAAESGETVDLVNVEAEMEEYLQRFPNGPHAAEVRELHEELDHYRLQRRYERRARLRGGTDNLGPVERAYVKATRNANLDPLAAAEQLRAILDVYEGAELSESDQRCLTLTRERLQELEAKSRDQSSETLSALLERLDTADALAEEAPERARQLRRGIVTLYADSPWAAAAVQRARAALAADHE